MRKSLSKPQTEFKSFCIKLMLFKTFLFQIVPTNNAVGALSDHLYYKSEGINNVWPVFSWVHRHSTPHQCGTQVPRSHLGCEQAGHFITLESELINVREALVESRSCNPCFVITQADSSNVSVSSFHYKGNRAS